MDTMRSILNEHRRKRRQERHMMVFRPDLCVWEAHFKDGSVLSVVEAVSWPKCGGSVPTGIFEVLRVEPDRDIDVVQTIGASCVPIVIGAARESLAKLGIRRIFDSLPVSTGDRLRWLEDAYARLARYCLLEPDVVRAMAPLFWHERAVARACRQALRQIVRLP